LRLVQTIPLPGINGCLDHMAVDAIDLSIGHLLFVGC
jgi:hypothetical protein